MRLLVAASVAVLALTSCAPDTSAAEQRCARTLTNVWTMAHPSASPDEQLAQAVSYAEECSAWAEDDPDGFLEQWG